VALALLAVLSGCAVQPTAGPTAAPVATMVPPTPTSEPQPTAAATPGVGSYEEWLAWYRYDAQASPEVEQVAAKQEGDVSIRDIRIAGPRADARIGAYLVVPPGEGPRPGILYVHWYGSATSNREEFLSEAVSLAKEGVASLLVDDLFARPSPRRLWTGINAEADRDVVAQQVVELRRALDVLIAEGQVDPARIAFVGHDFGAMFGAVLAGVDRRLRTVVLMTPVPDFADWFLFGSTLAGEREAQYRTAMRAVAPVEYIAHAAPASFLFQFAKSDTYVPKSKAEALFAAASEPKVIKWYGWSHNLQLDDLATGDRLQWLRTELGLPVVPAQ
jgi:dienelactone hydrolase